MHTKL